MITCFLWCVAEGTATWHTHTCHCKWFDLFCTITEDSCNRFSLATSMSLLRLRQVKKDIIQSGELKWLFTVSGRCPSIFLLLRTASGLLFLPVGSVTGNRFAISSELHNFFSLFFFSCQMVTNESNQLITFPEDILPTQVLQCPCWQNTQEFLKSHVLLLALCYINHKLIKIHLMSS